MSKLAKSIFVALAITASVANSTSAQADDLQTMFCDGYFDSVSDDCHANWQSNGQASEADCVEAAYAGCLPQPLDRPRNSGPQLCLL